MSASDHKISLSWAAAAFLTLGGVVATWDRVGWITIPAYAQDHTGASVEEQQKAILVLLEAQSTSMKMLQDGQDRNQDQWECDETDEELEDLAISLIGVQTPQEKAKLNRQKEKLNGVWGKLDCDRFTD